MLHIIGLILKIIGIMLLVILGIIVLLLCVVLFVPVRYEVKANFPGKLEELDIRAKATWLFHFVRADVIWENSELYWKIRAAWKVFDGSEAEEEKVTEPPKKQKEVPKKVETSKKAEVSKKTEHSKKTETLKQESTPKQKEVSKKAETSKKEEPKKESILEKVKKKILAVFGKIKYTFKKIYDKIKEGIDLKDKVIAFIEDASHRAALTRIKKELVWLKRFFKVTKGNINLRFGFEDPSVTGKILAVLGMIYPFVGGNMNVEPEFEEQCLEGNLYLKGRLRMIHLLMLVIKLLLDEHVRKIYQDVKAWSES